jgi:lysozyme family protein
MANVMTAIDYVIGQEVSKDHPGRVIDDPRDAGGKTRYGIAMRFHPELIYTGFFDASRTTDEYALQLAHATYDKCYAEYMMLDKIESQENANALLSFGINEGVATSVRVAQDAVGISPTGFFGPKTLNAVNTTPHFLEVLEARQIAHYQSIVEAKPDQACFLNGWINRVRQNCNIAP